MTTRSSLLALTLAAALAACGSQTDEAAPAPESPPPVETAKGDPEAPPADTPDTPPAETPETPTAKTPEAEPPKAPAAVDRGTEAELEKWADHMGDIPFVIGSRRGIEAAKASGKPLLFFYTATW